MARYVIGLDYGTDSARAIVVNAETGEIADAAYWRVANGRTIVGLDFPPSGSAFVVFRKEGTGKGRRKEIAASSIIPIDGSWQVSFPVDWYSGGKTVKSFAWGALNDWTAEDDPDVKYFSGTATYRKNVQLDVEGEKPDRRIILDLGEVKNFAEVTVNGKKYPPLWRPPFKVDVTDVVKTAASLDIEVKVTNLWPNRLIGDDRLCADDCEWNQRPRNGIMEYGIKAIPDWVQRGELSPTGRKTFTTWKHWHKSDNLFPSGMLGPVKIVRETVSAE